MALPICGVLYLVCLKGVPSNNKNTTKRCSTMLMLHHVEQPPMRLDAMTTRHKETLRQQCPNSTRCRTRCTLCLHGRNPTRVLPEKPRVGTELTHHPISIIHHPSTTSRHDPAGALLQLLQGCRTACRHHSTLHTRPLPRSPNHNKKRRFRYRYPGMIM